MLTPRAYVEEQLSLICGAPISPTDEQVKRFWTAFSREEEDRGRKDRHGNFQPEDSWLARCGKLEEPPLHEDLMAMQSTIGKSVPRWPRGHKFAAVLTHDVDRIVKLPWRERWRQLAALTGNAPLKQMARWAVAGATYAAGSVLGYSDLATFDHWMDEESRFGFHSTFFVLPERLEQPTLYDHYYRYADQIDFRGRRMSFTDGARQVHAQGWEIGVHGSYAGAVDQTIFAIEKARVEEMLGNDIVSARQHFLRFSRAKTPHIQAASGIQADSTLGFSSTIGCRAGLAFPYFWPGEDDLLEVPLIIQDVGLLRGRAQSLEESIERARTLIRRIADVGGVVTLSWHTHPESPGAHLCYRVLLESVAELGGWGCSLGEMNHWWRTRRDSLHDQVEKRHKRRQTPSTAQKMRSA